MSTPSFLSRIGKMNGGTFTAEDADILVRYLRARLAAASVDDREKALPLCFSCGKLATHQYRKEDHSYACLQCSRDYETHDLVRMAGASEVEAVMEILLRDSRKEVPK